MLLMNMSTDLRVSDVALLMASSEARSQMASQFSMGAGLVVASYTVLGQATAGGDLLRVSLA